MSEKSLRGTGLGAPSYESDRGVPLVDRSEHTYHCPNLHVIIIPLIRGAIAPTVWECPHCGGEALLEGAEAPEKAPVKPTRTHWDMLLERRSIYELQLLLEERLALLRGDERKSA